MIHFRVAFQLPHAIRFDLVPKEGIFVDPIWCGLCASKLNVFVFVLNYMRSNNIQI